MLFIDIWHTLSCVKLLPLKKANTDIQLNLIYIYSVVS